MMNVTTNPPSRFGWDGTTLEYVVKADGATDLALPRQECPGVEARLTQVNRTAEGVEARVVLDVGEGAFV